MFLSLFFSLLCVSPEPGGFQEENELYRQALKSIQREDWDEGILRMEHFVHYFADSKLAGNAIFWMAQAYLQKNEKALARDELHRLLRDYPKSSRTKQAADLLRKLSTPNQSGGKSE